MRNSAFTALPQVMSLEEPGGKKKCLAGTRQERLILKQRTAEDNILFRLDSDSNSSSANIGLSLTLAGSCAHT